MDWSLILSVLPSQVHILHEPRGATLEVCVSRMKMQSRPRFVLVSATVPNIEDIAAWIRYGSPPAPTKVFVVRFEDLEERSWAC
jgi:ATP-dependent DNA helicase HFM1/MER3